MIDMNSYIQNLIFIKILDKKIIILAEILLFHQMDITKIIIQMYLKMF